MLRLLLVCLSCVPLAAAADSMDSFPDGRMKALIFSYDDGPAQDRRFVDMLNRYSLVGTFHLNSGRLGEEAEWMRDVIGQSGMIVSADELGTLYAGHEVAGHTVNHPSLPDVSIDDAKHEVTSDLKTLTDASGQLVQSFAYPFGQYNDTVESALADSGIINARTVESTGSFELPKNLMRWHPTVHHSEALPLIDEFLSLQPDSPVVFMIWGHSWEFDGNKDDNNWGLAEEMCRRLSGHDDIWYVSMGEFTRYLAARQ